MSSLGLQALYPFSQTAAAAGMLTCMSAIAPTGSAAPLFLDEITSDEEERKLILRDGRRYPGDIMNVTANEITKMSAAVKEDVKAIRTPFMCIHGGEDKVCLPAGSEYLMNHTATPDSDKSLVVVKGLRHELFHEKEPHRSEAIAKVPEYFEKMCK
jgi:alpha-beta hydrolase superfamily lysophospholipase